MAFTGNHGKKLSERLNTPYEFETISQVLGALSVQADTREPSSAWGARRRPSFRSIIRSTLGDMPDHMRNSDLGAGLFQHQRPLRLRNRLFYRPAGPAAGHRHLFPRNAHQPGPAGPHFEAISLNWERKSSVKPANVACRCTVFTKSDMIHLQNRGEKLEDIIYGLHVGNARNYMSTIVSATGRLEARQWFLWAECP
jgi:hypothetical protein